MSVSDFQIIKKLGEGAYSSVFKVRRLVDDTVYALKKVKFLNLSSKQIYNACNEARILASIRHPNIIGYRQAFYDKGSKSLCIVMEYADGGDLLQKIFQYKNKGQYFQQAYILEIFTQVVLGLQKLHELGILHRDIKSANVFLTKNGIAKIGDLNVSKVLRKSMMCQTQAGTPYYASPQVWKDEPYDAKSDIWSLGCVLYQFTNLKPPFRAKDMEGLLRKVTRGYYPKINPNYSQDLSRLLKNLIQVKPSERLTADEILEQPIMRHKLKKIKNYELEEKCQLLKTIKITKNINSLANTLPEPNYSPLRYKEVLGNRSSIDHHPSKRKSLANDLDLHLSLPRLKGSIVSKSLAYSSRINRNERSKRKKSIVNEQALPVIARKVRDRSRGHLQQY